MFEIGFPELILIAIVGLLVIGPERLPEALRTLGLWIGRMRRSFTNVKSEIEREIGMDEIRRQLHNEAVMEEMKRIERDVRNSVHQNPPKERPEGTEPTSHQRGHTPAATDRSEEEPASDAGASPSRESDADREPPSEPPRHEPDQRDDQQRHG